MDNKSLKFELILFYSNIEFTRKSIEAGVDKIIIDWENKGKDLRQKLYDTQINKHTRQDLINVKKISNNPIITRVNKYDQLEPNEIESTIEAGTDEILLPMVKGPLEIEKTLKIIGDKSKLGILIETNDAILNIKEIAKLPISRVYVGLNDLAIERNLSNIFIPLFDGSIENIRDHFYHIPFGFGGLTHPMLGHPVPCKYLLMEMIRLNCNYSFLRRSFFSDAAGKISKTIREINNYIEVLRDRTNEEIKNDHLEFINFFNKEILLV